LDRLRLAGHFSSCIRFLRINQAINNALMSEKHQYRTHELKLSYCPIQFHRDRVSPLLRGLAFVHVADVGDFSILTRQLGLAYQWPGVSFFLFYWQIIALTVWRKAIDIAATLLVTGRRQLSFSSSFSQRQCYRIVFLRGFFCSKLLCK